MSRPMEDTPGSLGHRTLSPPDSSLDDLELDSCIEELDNLGDLGSGGLTRKPHFLDYDNKPPAELVEEHNRLNGTSPSSEVEQADVAQDCDPNYKQNVRQANPDVVVVPASVLPKIPTMNASYETPTALSILPTMSPLAKRVPSSIGSRGTWPLKERINPVRRPQHHTLKRELAEVGPKMECVYSLLSMLGSTNVLEMSSKFLELSRNEEKCTALRRSGCVPLLVHIIHNEPNEVARKNARHALVNVIRCNMDETSARRELKVLRLIDQLIDYTDVLKEQHSAGGTNTEENYAERQTPQDQERHPIQAIGTLAKISYDEDHRQAMCQFGSLQTISSLIQLDHLVHGTGSDVLKCIEMRRYASMVLTNLTFGQGSNKALLCSNREFMQALVSQLGCTELLQVTASVLRNLSWRADSVTKQTLIDIGTVKILTESAMRCTVENTLKSILSALWNLSNHCTQNRANICEVEGALEFLIDMLTYDAPSKTMSIVENAGGILRNISSHIAECEHYRRVLREKNCLKILLDQLKSPSLTVVSNACGTLGNISSDNGEDQQFLRDNGAIPMLRSLIYSKHNIISSGSRLALKNLQPRPSVETDLLAQSGDHQLKVGSKTTEPKDLPSLNVRKQRAMKEELGSVFYQHKGIVQKDDAPSEDEEHNELCEKRTVAKSEAAHQGRMEDRLVLESEHPTNYSMHEDLHQQQSSYDYQETDIDQLTDYSLRYAENQSDSDDEKEEAYCGDPANMLVAEDSVKCYYTEGTPQIISSATSMSDLRLSAAAPQPHPQPSPFKQVNALKSHPIPIGMSSPLMAPDDLGCNTPDKPYNYCEEGTPDFSRDASLSIIDLSEEKKKTISKGEPRATVDMLDGTSSAPEEVAGLPEGPAAKSVSFLNTAEETPLMFSRTSSMGSLSSAEPACTDDKSSIVSEFSRMASGAISPSELPDSPTQTNSPRRSVGESSTSACDIRTPGKSEHLPLPPQDQRRHDRENDRHDEQADGQEREQLVACRMTVARQPSAFEDTVNKFNVENTPAQFSCATSLSNLSIEEKEVDESVNGLDVANESPNAHRSSSPALPNGAEASHTNGCLASDGDSDAGGDDELLASCISIGMNSAKARSSAKDAANSTPTYASIPGSKGLPVTAVDAPGLLSCNVMLRRYCSESAAALQHSGETSNDDLGLLPIATGRDGADSDDSSDESDNNDRLLEECILSGMPKPKNAIDMGKQLASSSLHHTLQKIGPVEKESPFKMMRNPVHLQPLLPSDELSPFHVEDSPCNFSTISALSELTVASDTGPSQKPRERMDPHNAEAVSERTALPNAAENHSLSTPSNASDDDDQLLEEAIATGAIRKAEMAQHRRRTMLNCAASPMGRGDASHVVLFAAEVKRLNSPGVGSAGSTETAISDDEQHEDALLKEAIEQGMKKGRVGHGSREETERWLSRAEPSRRPVVESIPDSDRDDEDYQLLAECIQRGMHTVPKAQQDGFALASSLQEMKLSSRSAATTMQLGHPKNVHTTPVIPKDVGAAEVSAGVVSSASYQPQSTGTRASPSRAMYPYLASIGASTGTTNTAHRQCSITAGGLSSAVGPASCGRATPEGGAALPAATPASANGCNGREHPDGECAGAAVINPGRVPVDPSALEALPTTDKHKDPEQMLKSVERFTRELVSQSLHGRADETVAQGSPGGAAGEAPTDGATEPPVQFQLGGEVSFSVFSLQVDESNSLMEFVNLPNVEPPSMLNDDELFTPYFPTPSPLRVPFLPQFSSVSEMANINSIEPPTLMNESLGSLPSAKWGDGGTGADPAGRELPKIISSLSQAGARCHTPPSAGEAAECVPIADDSTVFVEELSPIRSIRRVTQAAEHPSSRLTFVTSSPALAAPKTAPSGDAKDITPTKTKAKEVGDATYKTAKDGHQQHRAAGKLAQPRTPSVPVDANKQVSRKSYVSPYGRVSGLPSTVRSKGPSSAAAARAAGGSPTVASGGTKIPSPPIGRTAKGPSVGTSPSSGGSSELHKTPKDSSKRSLGTSVRASPAVDSAVPSQCGDLNEPAKQPKGQPKRSWATPGGRVASAVRQSSTVVTKATGVASPRVQPKGAAKCNLAVCVTTDVQPSPPLPTPPTAPGTKANVVWVRQHTFVNDKPSMAALPHISSAPSSPAKVRRAGGDGAGTRGDVLTRANTTLQKRYSGGGGSGGHGDGAASIAGRVSRIPPPNSGGLMGARRKSSAPAGGRDVPQHSH